MLSKLQQRGVTSLFYIQTFSTLSFAVLFSSLVLYMTSVLEFTPVTANKIMGVFLGFNYGLHLLGGFLGGKLISNRMLFLFGMILQTIACFLMASSDPYLFCWSLALFLTGAGVNVTCLNMLLTHITQHDDHGRESAFFWNYSGMNIGFFIGFTVAGYFQLDQSYHYLFLFAAIGNLVALSLIMFNWQAFAEQQDFYGSKTILLIIILAMIIPFVYYCLNHPGSTNLLFIISMLLLYILLINVSYTQQTKKARNKILAFIIFSLASLIFWTLYSLAPMGLTIFTLHNVDRSFLGFNIPPQWFQNVNTIVIIIGGPLLFKLFEYLRSKGRTIYLSASFSAALILIGFGMLVLPYGIYHADTNGLTNMNWVVLSYILQSLGELLISPVGYAMIAKLAVPHLRGMLMGTWMFISGVASVLASYLSNSAIAHMESVQALATNSHYSQLFLNLGTVSIITGFIFCYAVPVLSNMAGEQYLTKSKQDDLFPENT